MSTFLRSESQLGSFRLSPALQHRLQKEIENRGQALYCYSDDFFKKQPGLRPPVHGTPPGDHQPRGSLLGCLHRIRGRSPSPRNLQGSSLLLPRGPGGRGGRGADHGHHYRGHLRGGDAENSHPGRTTAPGPFAVSPSLRAKSLPKPVSAYYACLDQRQSSRSVGRFPCMRIPTR